MPIENVKCPLCEGPMVSRQNRRDGSRFWGCRAYPTCRGTRAADGDAPDEPLPREAELPSERQRRNDSGRWRA